MSKPTTVALVTLGCARNDVDSEELAGRLAADGWTLVDDPAGADIALVNTCGFIESAKKDSVDALLEAHALKADGTLRAVVAVGCRAERYGKELEEALPKQMQSLVLMITQTSPTVCARFLMARNGKRTHLRIAGPSSQSLQ